MCSPIILCFLYLPSLYTEGTEPERGITSPSSKLMETERKNRISSKDWGAYKNRRPSFLSPWRGSILSVDFFFRSHETWLRTEIWREGTWWGPRSTPPLAHQLLLADGPLMCLLTDLTACWRVRSGLLSWTVSAASMSYVERGLLQAKSPRINGQTWQRTASAWRNVP
jgi:hypothetical protein